MNEDNKQLFMVCDLLGFRRFINRKSSFKDSFKVYQKILAKAFTAQSYDDDTYSNSLIVFSDTFVFIKPKKMSLERFIRTSSLMLHNLMLVKNTDPFLPVRGAIGYGEIIFGKHLRLFDEEQSPRNDIVFGKSFAEAYEWGESQEWLGISVTPKHLDDFKANIPLEQYEDYLVSYLVPSKCGSKQTLTCTFTTENHAKRLESICLNQIKKHENNERIKQKYINTHRFLSLLNIDKKYIPHK